MPTLSTKSKLSGSNKTEDRNSMFSASSDNSTLIDLLSQSQRFSVSDSQTQPQTRKFTAALGKPGNAKIIREAVSNYLKSVNALRTMPIAGPMDYEKFVLEKYEELNRDRDRDLLLFPRDDFTETKLVPDDDLTKDSLLKEAEFLLTKDTLEHLYSPCSVVNFNYANFSGEYRKPAAPLPDLNSLKFESDIIVEENSRSLNDNSRYPEVIKEGLLSVLPSDSSFVDNFRSEKKRYCVIRRNEDGTVLFEAFKQQQQQNQTQQKILQMEVKAASLKSTKKGRTVLQLSNSTDSAADRRILLSAESDAELALWLIQLDRALTWDCCCRDDCLSLNSSGREHSLPPGDSDSLASEESSSGSQRDPVFAAWRGRNAAAKSLQPPIVERRNLFALYGGVELRTRQMGVPDVFAPKFKSIVSSECIGSSAQPDIMKKKDVSTHGTPTSAKRKTAPNSLPQLTTFQSDSNLNSRSMVPSEKCQNKFSTPQDPTLGVLNKRSPHGYLIAELRDLSLRLSLAGSTPRQIEPFFLRLFFVNSSTGSRVSEEFHITVPSEVQSENSPSFRPSSRHLIFALDDIRTDDIFLIILVERPLVDSQFADVYAKSRGAVDAKSWSKLVRAIGVSAQKLVGHRTLLSWTAIAATSSSSDSEPRELPLFKCEGRFTDVEIQKALTELTKAEKSGKIALTQLIGATITVDTGVVASIGVRLPQSTDINSVERAVSLEMRSFHSKDSLEPYKNFFNFLYIYPMSLSYGNQKVFSKARNIVCNVRFVPSQRLIDLDKEHWANKAIIDPSEQNGPYIAAKSCTMQYHEQNPQFNDEVKVRLPCSLGDGCHLLFTFTHISLSSAFSPKAKNESFENSVGFAWLPLVVTKSTAGHLAQLVMTEDVQEFQLPIATNLPSNYFLRQMLPGDEAEAHSESTKLIENGRPLFRFRLRLVSSVFSTTSNLQTFFQACQLFQNNFSIPRRGSLTSAADDLSYIASVYDLKRSSPPSEDRAKSEKISIEAQTLLVLKIEDLKKSDISRILPFLYVSLNRLFVTITTADSDRVCLAALDTIVDITSRVTEHYSRLDDNNSTTRTGQNLLEDFILLHFRPTTTVLPTTVPSSNSSNKLVVEETTHNAICKTISALLASLRTDENVALGTVFRQLWFLFGCTVKSAATWLTRNGINRFKTSHRERFSNDFLLNFGDAIHSIVDKIVEKHREFPADAEKANLALAGFFKYSLNLFDRFTVMKQLTAVVEKYDSSESRFLRNFKLQILQVLAGHEHWLPLCLPLLTNKYGDIMRGDLIAPIASESAEKVKKDSITGGGFLSKFFAKIFSPIHGTQDEISERYSDYVEHFYLSETYCRTHFLSGLLLQEMAAAIPKDPRDYRKKVIVLLRNLLCKHSSDLRYKDKSSLSRIAILYIPLIRIIVENVHEIETVFRLTGPTSPKVSPAPIATMRNNDTTLLSNSTLENISRLSVPSVAISNAANSNGQIDAYSTSRLSTSTGKTVETLQQFPTNATGNIVFLLAEKLDKNEASDLIVSALFILAHLPKKVLSALFSTQEAIEQNVLSAKLAASPEDGQSQSKRQIASGSGNVYVDFIRILELALKAFRYRGRAFYLREETERFEENNARMAQLQQQRDREYNSNNYNALNVEIEDEECSILAQEPSPVISQRFLLDANLCQEVALVVLDTGQTLANQIAAKWNYLSNTISYPNSSQSQMEAAFGLLLNLEIQLLEDHWPEAVRLHALASLAIFINLFSHRFFLAGPLDYLSTLIEALLLQLNSRFSKVQNAAAALLQLILRNGYDTTLSSYAKQPKFHSSAHSNFYYTNNSNNLNNPVSTAERLGRPGTQIGVCLAHLLGKNPALINNPRFLRGLESIAFTHGNRSINDTNNTSYPYLASIFEKAVTELVQQLKSILEATQALTRTENDEIHCADLHIELANNFRGSAALRCAWFDNLAKRHEAGKWHSEMVVCLLHSLAIIGKELSLNGIAKIDWSLFDCINDGIAEEEGVFGSNLENNTQQAGFTLDNFLSRVESIVQNLILSERYEAIGPIYRLVIPVYESRNNWQALVSLYAEIQQTCSRVAEIKTSKKRHLGSYFKVVFYGQSHFGSEHCTEWVYREPRITSLAEACDRIVDLVRAAGHDRVQLLSGPDITSLDDTVAYVRIAHIEPCSAKEIAQKFEANNGSGISGELLQEEGDPTSYWLHTNLRTFIYEEKTRDARANTDDAEQAKLSVRRVLLTVENGFPNTRRRSRVVSSRERLLSPLELACENLVLKATQIRRILAMAGIPQKATFYDGASLKRLDLKQLQLYLQGSVSPTVNVGVLSYAEAFTAPKQKERYGQDGMAQLVLAFKILVSELADAICVNRAAMGNDRADYQKMLENSFEGMIERLSVFFNGEKFISENAPRASRDQNGVGVAQTTNNAPTEVHIFNSISGINY